MFHRIRPLLAAAVLAGIAMPSQAASVVMRDDFSNPASGWYDNGNRAERARGFSIYTPSGKYQMSPVQGGTLGISLAPRQPRGADVRVESDVFMYAGIGAGAAGVVCRQGDRDNLYAFLVTGAPGWLILKVVDGKPVRLAGGALPRAAVPGAVDTRLTAECDGDALTMRVGGRQVGTARDAMLPRGSSGLIVMGEELAGTNAQFDDFVLTDLGGGDAATLDDAQLDEPVHTDPQGPSGGLVARGADGDRPARAGRLRPGEALVVVEYNGYRGEAVIGMYSDGRLKLHEQYDTARNGSLNLQITLSGDSAYANLRTGSTAASQIANWDIEFDAARERVSCERMDLYTDRRGVLSLWNYQGERICRIL